MLSIKASNKGPGFGSGKGQGLGSGQGSPGSGKNSPSRSPVGSPGKPSTTGAGARKSSRTASGRDSPSTPPGSKSLGSNPHQPMGSVGDDAAIRGESGSGGGAGGGDLTSLPAPFDSDLVSLPSQFDDMGQNHSSHGHWGAGPVPITVRLMSELLRDKVLMKQLIERIAPRLTPIHPKSVFLGYSAMIPCTKASNEYVGMGGGMGLGEGGADSLFASGIEVLHPAAVGGEMSSAPPSTSIYKVHRHVRLIPYQHTLSTHHHDTPHYHIRPIHPLNPSSQPISSYHLLTK